MAFNEIKIGDNHIEIKPKTALMIIGAIGLIVAFLNAKEDYAMSLFIISGILVLLAGDYYKEL
jgi:hypothetical membrane protein